MKPIDCLNISIFAWIKKKRIYPKSAAQYRNSKNKQSGGERSLVRRSGIEHVMYMYVTLPKGMGMGSVM